MIWLYVLLAVAGLIIGFLLGIIIQKKKNENENIRLNKTAEEIINRAKREADEIVKEAKLEAKEIIFKGKQELEKEVKEKRKELQLQEKRLISKEETIDKKLELVDKKEELISKREQELENKLQQVKEKMDEAENLRSQLLNEIEKVAGMTRDEAKEMLINEMVAEAKKEAARTLKEIEEETKLMAEKKAQSIIATAIQRCAPEYVGEVVVSVVSLPNDEMKGRIIGREGRNIRTFESITGVDIIVDDTPEAVILSSYDPFRREIAKLTLEKLIADGRIHPARIEEVYEKSKAELEKYILEVGEETAFNLGLHNIHPELLKLIGRLKYRTSYGQNVLAHSIEVAKIAGIMAAELGLDEKLAKRAGLLHDIGKAIDQESEGSHTEIGVEIAKKYNEHPMVINAILSHHGEEEFKFVESVLIQAADAISASRPGARREVLESYIKRLEKLEEIAGSFEGVNKSFAIQAGREVRIIVEPDKIGDDEIITLSRDISKRIEEELTYPGQIKVVVIRESRAVEYAK
ncbi:ribonuclease Y [Deferribacter autotrophicus]|uniref:Ribonuclease Y n=1 Tax=Deferribacter autotrophicus TaxID=500465 RepID=A0A5A8F0B1_9BACT|nr:ribonuclease Y [Deferribacter autotrophicus]KAA0257242.1 ribonuclease Y [Deferribacter autotrophicus]